MHTRLAGYRQGHEPLTAMSYFCLTVLEDRFGGRNEAARGRNVDPAVLGKIGRLSATKGGPQARKAAGIDTGLSSQETVFLTQVIAHLVIRLARVSGDAGRELPRITLLDFPDLDD